MYNPDKYVLLKIVSHDSGKEHYKIFGTWYGDFTTGDSWRINSGIKVVEDHGNYYDVIGHSGSVYRCFKNSEGASMYSGSILQGMIDDAREQASIEVVEMAYYIDIINNSGDSDES